MATTTIRRGHDGEGLSGPALATAIVGAATAAALVASVLADAGTKQILVAAGAIAVALVLLFARDRALAILLLLVLNLQFLFHKSFGTIDPDVVSGAPSLYLTNVYVLLALLYGLWIADGTLVSDLRRAARERAIVLPLVGGLLAVPSILVATDPYLTFIELVRMAWVYLLFLYVACRLRSKRELGALIGALAVVVVVQCGIAILQWRTGGTLGLATLGEESELFTRVLDEGEIPRPSGTVIHPVFLAALTAPIALLALSFGVNLVRGRWRIASVAIVPVAVAPLVLSQARSSLVGFAVALAVLGAFYLWRGRLPWRVVGYLAAGSLLAVVLFWGQIGSFVENNLGTDHFATEVESRLELNAVALRMIAAQPVLGVGLNNYMAVEDRYDTYGVLFEGFPVHNWYLLVLAETGIVGLAGLVVGLGIAIVVAWRLALVQDRLLAAFGVGILATYVFFLVEELLGYSLREEMPLLLVALLGGASIACRRMANEVAVAPESDDAG